jgi:hypothetical protein
VSRQQQLQQAASAIVNAARQLVNLETTLAGIASSAMSATTTETAIRQFASTMNGYPPRQAQMVAQVTAAIQNYVRIAGGQ